MSEDLVFHRALSRRSALGLIGAVSGSLTLAQCSGASGSTLPATNATPAAVATVTPTPSASAGANATPTANATATAKATATPTPAATVTSPSTASSACAVAPAGEIGPYFADDTASGFDRSNIVANIDGTNAQSGVALTLNISVVDTEKSCAPYAGAQVDIWHCNALGVYSDISSENTTGQTYLRGYQITNAAGLVHFTTIVPGWYPGRTQHIHVRVRSNYSDASSTGDGTNTTQLFFPQATVDYLNRNVAPYNAEGVDPTTNANDHVYTPETQGETLLTLSGSYASGFTATFTIGLPIGG